MADHRFFAPGLSGEGLTALLPDEEGRHLSRVLRLGPGAPIVVFDGRGNEFTACVEAVGRDGVRVRTAARRPPAPECAVRLTLAQAVVRGEKMDDIVRDATMLGVAAVQPLTSARGTVPPGGLRSGRAVERWRRIAIASAKQCGRAVVPEILSPQPFETVVASAASALRVLLVEPSASGAGRRRVSGLRDLGIPASATVAVGPEGGWTPDEIARATAAGFVPVTLGRRTLRADAAPVAALAVLQFLWDDW